MSSRPLLLLLSMLTMPFVGRSQSPTAVDVIKDMVAYVKIPAPVNPACSYHVVNISASIANNAMSYAAASKLFTGTATAVVMGSKVVYNTMVTSRVPMPVREFTAGNTTPVDRNATVSFGWAGTNSTTVGTITVSMPNDQKKVYALPSDLKVTTLATGNKYMLSGTLKDGPVVAIYMEKSAFSDCK